MAATKKTAGAELPSKQTTEVAERQPSLMARFTDRVMKEFGEGTQSIEVSLYQRALIQGYFWGVDAALTTAEEDRLRKNARNSNHDYDNTLPVTWKNVDMDTLAMDLVYMARLGLDMRQKNMLFPIPYKNNKLQKYTITLMPGYNGIKFTAEKYALVKPKNVVIELVYSNDTFRAIKKTLGQSGDQYEFVINDPFDRGEIRGGFGYIEYEDHAKNELVIMSLADILKRKPAYASANFWGGTATSYKNGKKVTEEVDGWFDRMCYKTVVREVFGERHIPRDPAKIDENYRYLKRREAEFDAMQAQAEIDANANRTYIDADFVDVHDDELPAELPPVDEETGEVQTAIDEPDQSEETDGLEDDQMEGTDRSEDDQPEDDSDTPKALF